MPMLRTLLIGCATAAVLVTVSASTQTPAPPLEALTFEVASIKENRSGDGQRGAGFQPGGRLRARNMTVRGLIAAAYGTPQPLPLFRVVGGPGWIDDDRYDIEATADRGAADVLTHPGWSPRGQAMLRALMAERFKRVDPKAAAVGASAGTPAPIRCGASASNLRSACSAGISRWTRSRGTSC